MSKEKYSAAHCRNRASDNAARRLAHAELRREVGRHVVQLVEQYGITEAGSPKRVF